MVKCDVCNEKIEVLFLSKINGTYIKQGKRLKAVCNSCQRKLGDKVKEQI